MTPPVCPWCNSTPPHHERCEQELVVWVGSARTFTVEPCACPCRLEPTLW